MNTSEAYTPEARSRREEIDVGSLFDDPTPLLDYLDEEWTTDSLGVSQRTFETNIEKGKDRWKIALYKDSDTRSIRLVASKSGTYNKGGRSSISLPDVTFMGIYPGISGFNGMITVITENGSYADIRTTPNFRKISMTAINKERTDIE